MPDKELSEGVEQLKLLMEYTRFHIGLYISLFTAMLAFLRYKKEKPRSLDWFVVAAILLFLVAGAAGAIIGSNIPDHPSWESFSSATLGPWWLPGVGLQYVWWSRIEHTAFWLGAIAIAIRILWPLAIQESPG